MEVERNWQGCFLYGISLGDDLDRTKEFYTDIFDKQAEINLH